jgi:hypothetical protein
MSFAKLKSRVASYPSKFSAALVGDVYRESLDPDPTKGNTSFLDARNKPALRMLLAQFKKNGVGQENGVTMPEFVDKLIARKSSRVGTAAGGQQSWTAAGGQQSWTAAGGQQSWTAAGGQQSWTETPKESARVNRVCEAMLTELSQIFEKYEKNAKLAQTKKQTKNPPTQKAAPRRRKMPPSLQRAKKSQAFSLSRPDYAKARPRKRVMFLEPHIDSVREVPAEDDTRNSFHALDYSNRCARGESGRPCTREKYNEYPCRVETDRGMRCFERDGDVSVVPYQKWENFSVRPEPNLLENF